MEILRTPDDCFERLPDFPWVPQYLDVGDEGLRMAWVEAGPRDGHPVLLLHGEPSWSFLYRKMIGPLAEAGFRVLAPDLIGFGRSDKPAAVDDYSYAGHLRWLRDWLDALSVEGATLFCQDWGGLLGLRIAAEEPERFARIVAANTFLPTGDQDLGEAFHRWKDFSVRVDDLPVGKILERSTVTDLPEEVVAAYEAPFPTPTYKAGAKVFPSLVPSSPDDPETEANRRAWEALGRWEKPFLTAFSDSDPITRGGEQVFQSVVPGARNRSHVTIEGAGHFLQEDRGERCAEVLLAFIEETG